MGAKVNTPLHLHTHLHHTTHPTHLLPSPLFHLQAPPTPPPSQECCVDCKVEQVGGKDGGFHPVSSIPSPSKYSKKYLSRSNTQLIVVHLCFTMQFLMLPFKTTLNFVFVDPIFQVCFCLGIPKSAPHWVFGQDPNWLYRYVEKSIELPDFFICNICQYKGG